MSRRDFLRRLVGGMATISLPRRPRRSCGDCIEIKQPTENGHHVARRLSLAAHLYYVRGLLAGGWIDAAAVREYERTKLTADPARA